ncbi:hypothetical protein ACHAXT_012758 [Thalassiosira profunda]
MANAYEKGISAVTMSKPWGGCGITIGWLACPDKEMVQRLVDVQYFGTACPSRASEVQARMVLRVSDAILNERRDIIRKNKFKGPGSSAELGRQLADAGISIKPAYCFSRDAEGAGIPDYFRVGFGESKMPAALEALGRFVEAHAASWRAAMAE